ncbi:MAG: DUF4405 domain-containing protein [Phycisphaerales bacterium]|nr:DUF4405 domain-containing protein [Phycisphaerales bacterium]
MRRNTLNYLVDFATLLAILVMVATGLVIRFVLPPGTGGGRGGRGFVLWGLGRHDWGDVHFWASVVLGVLLVVHVALHWSWVCTVSYRLLRGAEAAGSPSPAKRNAYGVAFLVILIVIFGGFTWYAGTTVREVASSEDVEEHVRPIDSDHLQDERGRDRGGGHSLVQGSMTLAEVEAATGVPVAILKSELGLPENVADGERLGRLGRQYDFDMDEVRDIVTKHRSRPAR